MKPGLTQIHSQKQILSPLLRQYLKLLYLPIMDLKNVINEELSENPVLEENLELKEDSYEEENGQDSLIKNKSENNLNDNENFPNEELTWTAQKTSNDMSYLDPQSLAQKKDFADSLITKQESLFEYLTWQLHFMDLTNEAKSIAKQIVGNINSDGYLTSSCEDIAKACSSDTKTVLEILTKIQTLDPPGVGATTLSEALLIQFKQKGIKDRNCEEIISNHLSVLARKDWKKLSKTLNTTEEKIKTSALIISQLEPKPGRTFYTKKVGTITPDAIISLEDGSSTNFDIEIEEKEIPVFSINPSYRKMLRDKKTNSETKKFLKEKIQAGADLLKSLALRKSTLRLITEELVKTQPDFFMEGFSSLHPLRLKDIAEKVKMHESTVSRAIHGKYMKTPQGTIPYKSFFSQRIQTEDGDGESQKSIVERIRAMIEQENQEKPLSDGAIAKNLTIEGIKIARRTVAKYRELLKIMPTYLRKKR